jgi:hypothetical protein
MRMGAFFRKILNSGIKKQLYILCFVLRFAKVIEYGFVGGIPPQEKCPPPAGRERPIKFTRRFAAGDIQLNQVPPARRAGKSINQYRKIQKIQEEPAC